MFIPNISQQSDLKLTSFCLDHISSKWLNGNWVAWPPYYFFVQNRRWSKNDIFQSSYTKVEFSRDITIQDEPDRKAYWVDVSTWGRPHVLFPKTLKLSLTSVGSNSLCRTEHRLQWRRNSFWNSQWSSVTLFLSTFWCKHRVHLDTLLDEDRRGTWIHQKPLQHTASLRMVTSYYYHQANFPITCISTEDFLPGRDEVMVKGALHLH